MNKAQQQRLTTLISQPVSWQCRTFAPAVSCRVVDGDLIEAGFMGEFSSHGAGKPDFALPNYRLKVMGFDRRLLALAPGHGGGIANIHRLNTAAAQQV